LHLYNLEAAIFNPFLKILQHASLSALKMLKHGLSLFLVTAALESGRDAFQQFTQTSCHILLKFDPLSGGQAEHNGSVSVTEIVDVALVGELGRTVLILFEKSFDRGGSSGAGQAGDEDIEPIMCHLKTNAERTERTVLSDNLLDRLYSFHGGDSEILLRDLPAQTVRGEFHGARGVARGWCTFDGATGDAFLACHDGV
jgi:hypothetical protein